jgi:hypothetical protein
VTKREFLAGWYTEFLDFTDDIEAQELVEALAERLPELIRTAQEAQRAAIRDRLTSPEVTWDNDADLVSAIDSVPLAGLE